MKKIYFRLSLLPLLLFPLGLAAHSLKLSDSELIVEGSSVRWTHKVHQSDFDLKFSRADRATLQSYIPQRLGLRLGGETCLFQDLAYAQDKAVEAVILTLRYECPKQDSELSVHYDLFYGDLSHRHLMKWIREGKPLSVTFAPGQTDFRSSGDGLWQSIWNFLKLGFEHILIGYDHILFVLTLILGAKRFKDLLWLVTSFTLAHSITLALATLEILTLPPTVVEPVIAASIVFLAIQDIFAKGSVTPRSMIFLTFGFGLIHGLGFSYVLQGANLKAGHLAIPLVFFNLGVELGQILVIALVYPLTLGLNRLMKGLYLPLKRGILALIAGVGLYWMVERLFFG